ncbi:ABA4-like family protein [Nonomuraea sediminis]|uniref:ABA4-like family protein n=1 Tax=Nonomuraea sediminis TaxID=2835864 RepID=UPI001BDCBC25|nr:ABA4-like family protein [Nonomuraea sediminis]
MSTSSWFSLSFYLAAPFWALMILAPTWKVTRRIAGSPLIVLPALAVNLVLLLPLFADFWPVVSRPSLAGLQHLVSSPEALTALWAQIIAWDLFLGRWIYLDSRERGVHPLLMAPVMVLTILLSPLGFPLYLAIRLAYRQNSGVAGATARPVGRTMA